MASTSSGEQQSNSKMSSQGPGKEAGKKSGLGRRMIGALAMACAATTLGGCDNALKNLGDYLNLRNSLLTPSEVGRFDKDNPWGNVRPVKWPILDQLDVIDAPANEWESATDPTMADTVTENKEFSLGAGDLVRISIYDLAEPGKEYFKEQAISETGTVDILYLGSVKIAGLTPQQANEKIGQEAIAKHALLPAGNGSPGPQVSVTVLQSRGRIFSVLGLGTAARPGTYNIIGSNFRLLDALALAGDIQVQPGLDYLYVIRPIQTEAPAPITPPGGMSGTTNGAGTTEGTTGTTGGNPLDALESIERNTTQPAGTTVPPATTPNTPVVPGPAPTTPTTPPAMPSTVPGPSSAAPVYLRPLPPTITADTLSKAGTRVLAQADLDAAMSTSAPAPRAGGSGTASSAVPKEGDTATRPGSDSALDNAMDSSGSKGEHYMFIGGKWVLLPATTNPAGTGTAGTPGAPAAGEMDTAVAAPGGAVNVGHGATVVSGTDMMAVPDRLVTQRVIRIPIAALRSGDPRYNIIIKPGDVINVPPVETGEFYVMGHVTRPGVFQLTGRKITLKMAIAAAGNLDALAIPRKCDLVRRIGTNQEATVQVNLQAIFDGTQPDIFLKPNDLINVGTDMISPFLAVTRNAYRLSYGFGFVYDRNYYIQPQGAIQQ